MRTRAGHHADAVQRRLAALFEVPFEAVARLDGAGTSSFYIAGDPDPFGREWWYHDGTTMSASAHPIMTPEVIADETGKELRTFVRKLRNDRTDLELVAPPLSYMHHNSVRDTIVAANDLMGIGRLYYADVGSGTVLSNSVLAVAVARDCPARQDDDFWSVYYVSGGGVDGYTYIKGVELAPPGSIATLTRTRFSLRQKHPLQARLLASREDVPSLESALDAGARKLDLVSPHLHADAELKLSGGIDSRLVAAMAIDSGLDFTAQTYVPPALESEIAEQLHRLSPTAFHWERLEANPSTIRQDAADPQSLTDAPEPILARADAWFSHVGGDHWSTFIRSNTPTQRERRSRFALSGTHGDLARAHHYSKRDVTSGEPSGALRRYATSFRKNRAILPEEIRERGSQILRDNLLEIHFSGFTGFYALDYAFITNRVRRQFPPLAPAVVAPLLTPEMVLATFWQPPAVKAAAGAMREMTSRLLPQWREVPYYHEAAVGTDHSLTNKVSVQRTYWEGDEQDFYDSLESALEDTDFARIAMADVRREIEFLPEGRNRTNQTFEFIFWHSAAVRSIGRVNSIWRALPA